MTTMLSGMATPRQVEYMRDLCNQRVVPDVEKLIARLDRGDVTFEQAKVFIPILKDLPWKPRVRSANPVTEEGLYEHGDLVYRVQRSKSSGNLYALVLDVTLTEAARRAEEEPDNKIRATFTYDKGAIFKIDATHRITPDRAIELSLHFVNCLVCGRKLTAKQSVERSIGPVCITRV